MRKALRLKLSAAVITTTLLSGCANQDTVPNLADGVDKVIQGVGSVAGGFFQPYTNGIEVTQHQLAQLEEGMSPDEVEGIVGFPPDVRAVNGDEVWSYPFTKMTHFGENTNETTVIRFKNGKLAKAYKTNSRTSKTGHPIVDAANGVH